jgi:hypothetical protein
MTCRRAMLFFSLAISASACGPSPEIAGGDTGTPGHDAATTACAADPDCDDGMFCNGVERCAPTMAGADARGCAAASTPPCAAASCDEAMDRCSTGCPTPDADGDGARSAACGGGDCDDADPDRFPGHTEVCDTLGHDEDCDPGTYGVRDADGDGAPDATCCNTGADAVVHCGDDCDDARAGVHPSAPEVCDARDNDCDMAVDELVIPTWYEDADGDGYGSDAVDAATTMACMRPLGYSDTHDDCDDRAAAGGDLGGARAHPGGVETCDAAMLDEDCNGTPNDPPEGCACMVGDPPRSCLLGGVCAAGNETCMGGTWGMCSIMPTAEVCDGVRDEDCDGHVDEGVRTSCYVDADGDGYATLDSLPSEICRVSTPDRAGPPFYGCPVGYTGLAPTTRTDADCDDVTVGSRAFATCYRDCDADGWGIDPAVYFCEGATGECLAPAGGCPGGQWVRRTGDCVPTVATAYPGQSAFFTTYNCCGALGGWDYDCSGAIEMQDARAGVDCQPDGAGGCIWSVGWYGTTAPACGVMGYYQTGCEPYWDIDRWDCMSVGATQMMGCH